MKNCINELKKNNIEENITKSRFSKILSDFKNEIDYNKKKLEAANKIDLEYTNKKIDIKEIKNIIDIYNIPLEAKIKNDKYIVKYVGDPYLTVHLMLQAIVQKVSILLVKEEYMLGTNRILFTIFNKVLEKYNLEKEIILYDTISSKDLKELETTDIPTIIIGDTFTYQTLQHKRNVVFYPYNNILLFYEDESFEELSEHIINYARENEYEIEVLSTEKIDEAIEEINFANNIDVVIWLSKNVESQDIKEKIQNKKVYINENPFTNVTGRVFNYFKSLN